MIVHGGNQIQYQIVGHQRGMNYLWVGTFRETRLFWAVERGQNNFFVHIKERVSLIVNHMSVIFTHFLNDNSNTTLV